MKIITFLILALLLIPVVHAGAQGENEPADIDAPGTGSNIIHVTIAEVVSNPKQFDKLKVSLEGRVTKVEYKQSLKGERFAIFELKDPEKNKVNVYFEDDGTRIAKGDEIRIMGRFWKEKSYFLYKIKNVVRARTVEPVEIPQSPLTLSPG
ncbi:MAG TPA: hypothetical protein PKC29_06825 [Thermodesulfobacteriota bacterium]|nr:hypothetical protein [Thermodesulfobacteriota bacterium]